MKFFIPKTQKGKRTVLENAAVVKTDTKTAKKLNIQGIVPENEKGTLNLGPEAGGEVKVKAVAAV